jgi:hypothetical protein
MKQLFFLLFFTPICLIAQQKAQFESSIFFEDAIGNRDTIIVAYDTTAQDFNPQFGEKNITEPWDSIFEVRATNQENYQAPIFLSKKIVARTKGPTHPQYYCPPIIGSILIFTHIKHFPLKVTWKKEDHNNFCNFGNFLINNIGPWFFPDWHKGMPKDQYRCMSQDSIFNIPRNLEGNYNFYFVGNLNNGKQDSILGIMLEFAYKGAFWSNCGTVFTNDFFSDLSIKIFPNPAHDLLNINILDNFDPLQVECFDIQGRKVYQCDFQNATQINSAAWSRGLYAILIRDEIGRLVKTEKVILE